MEISKQLQKVVSQEVRCKEKKAILQKGDFVREGEKYTERIEDVLETLAGTVDGELLSKAEIKHCKQQAEEVLGIACVDMEELKRELEETKKNWKKGSQKVATGVMISVVAGVLGAGIWGGDVGGAVVKGVVKGGIKGAVNGGEQEKSFASQSFDYYRINELYQLRRQQLYDLLTISFEYFSDYQDILGSSSQLAGIVQRYKKEVVEYRYNERLKKVKKWGKWFWAAAMGSLWLWLINFIWGVEPILWTWVISGGLLLIIWLKNSSDLSRDRQYWEEMYAELEKSFSGK